MEGVSSSFLSAAVTKTITKSNLGRKGTISSYMSQSIIEGSQDRSSSMNLKPGQDLTVKDVQLKPWRM